MMGQQVPVQERPQQITTMAPHIHPPQINQAGIPIYQLNASDIQALLTHYTAAAGVSTRGGSQEYNMDYGVSALKVSEGEKHRMQKMCGLENTAVDECFPKWYRELFAKHQDKKDKSQVITTAIEKCYIFDDSEVPLHPTLAKIIINRNRTASDTRKRASIVNYARRVSPFVMVYL